MYYRAERMDVVQSSNFIDNEVMCKFVHMDAECTLRKWIIYQLENNTRFYKRRQIILNMRNGEINKCQILLIILQQLEHTASLR
jgi:hypothetical protein